MEFAPQTPRVVRGPHRYGSKQRECDNPRNSPADKLGIELLAILHAHPTSEDRKIGVCPYFPRASRFVNTRSARPKSQNLTFVVAFPLAGKGVSEADGLGVAPAAHPTRFPVRIPCRSKRPCSLAGGPKPSKPARPPIRPLARPPFPARGKGSPGCASVGTELRSPSATGRAATVDRLVAIRNQLRMAGDWRYRL